MNEDQATGTVERPGGAQVRVEGGEGQGLVEGGAWKRRRSLPQTEWAVGGPNCFVTNWHPDKSRDDCRWSWGFICGR